MLCAGGRGGETASKEDPDHWEWPRPDPGEPHASQRQAWREGEGSAECKYIIFWQDLLFTSSSGFFK